MISHITSEVLFTTSGAGGAGSADRAVINSIANMHSIINESSIYCNKLHVSFCFLNADIIFQEYCIQNKRQHLQIDRAGG